MITHMIITTPTIMVTVTMITYTTKTTTIIITMRRMVTITATTTSLEMSRLSPACIA
jgi:hypothetical protein